MTMTTDERMAKGIGVLSGALAAAFLLAPGAVLRVAGLRPDRMRTALVRLIGVREAAAAAVIAARPRPAGGLWARVGGDLKDVTLLALALRDPSADRGRVAGALAFVGSVTLGDLLTATALSRHPTRDRTGEKPRQDGMRLARAVTVSVEPQRAYAAWRDLEALPRFMAHLESVEVTGERTSRWTARAPGGSSVSWEAEITQDVPGERLAWRSLPDSAVRNDGEVRFTPAPRGQGTEIHAVIRYEPPAGRLGATVARLMGEEPRQQLADDLRRFAQLMETGTVTRSDAALHGRRLPQRPAQPPSITELDGNGVNGHLAHPDRS